MNYTYYTMNASCKVRKDCKIWKHTRVKICIENVNMQEFWEEGKCAFWGDMITLKGFCFIGDKLWCARVITSFVKRPSIWMVEMNASNASINYTPRNLF